MDYYAKPYSMNFIVLPVFISVVFVAVYYAIVINVCVVGSPGTPDTCGR